MGILSIMNIKYLFSLYFLIFLTSGYVLADNPGDEVVVTEAVATEETSEDEAATESTDSSGEVVSSGDEEVVKLQKVVVTGSRIKRTDLSGALPLLVITKEDIDAGGFRNITEALQAVPAANAFNQNEQC